MALRRSGDKPLSEPIMVSLLTHICVTRPQWVNPYSFRLGVIYMRHLTASSLVQARPDTYLIPNQYLNLYGSDSEWNNFQAKKCIWKSHLQKLFDAGLIMLKFLSNGYDFFIYDRLVHWLVYTPQCRWNLAFVIYTICFGGWSWGMFQNIPCLPCLLTQIYNHSLQ